MECFVLGNRTWLHCLLLVLLERWPALQNLIPHSLTKLTVGTAMPNVYLDVTRICKEHGEAINSHAPASCRRKAVLQCGAEVLINKHGFIITCSFCLNEKISSKRWAVQSETVPLLLTPTKKGGVLVFVAIM